MIDRYKLRPSLFQAVIVTSINEQAAEIAAMIKATSWNVGIEDGVANFTVANYPEQIKVKAGQVVTSTAPNGISVYQQEEFAALFEPYESPVTKNPVNDA